MAKKSFINTKNVGKKIAPAFMSTALTSGGYIGGEILINKTLTGENMKKLKGPLAFVLGTAAVAIADERDGKWLADVGRGLAAAGARYTVDALVPEETKSKMGLNPLSGVVTEKQNNEKMLEEIAAEAVAQINGIFDQQTIPGSTAAEAAEAASGSEEAQKVRIPFDPNAGKVMKGEAQKVRIPFHPNAGKVMKGIEDDPYLNIINNA
ncbi:MAG TPA: hypothetical protein PLA62_09150 [Clostridia bacterium]|mgnify:FL=1|nr:hypothetical protein [Clostridia bacterium]